MSNYIVSVGELFKFRPNCTSLGSILTDQQRLMILHISLDGLLLAAACWLFAKRPIKFHSFIQVGRGEFKVGVNVSQIISTFDRDTKIKSEPKYIACDFFNSRENSFINGGIENFSLSIVKVWKEEELRVKMFAILFRDENLFLASRDSFYAEKIANWSTRLI